MSLRAMNKKYPKLGRSETCDRNTRAKCRCGEIGKRKVHIELNIFRGDDEVVWACMAHRLDIKFLLTGVRTSSGLKPLKPE